MCTGNTVRSKGPPFIFSRTATSLARASATRCALAGRIRGENKRLHHASSFGGATSHASDVDFVVALKATTSFVRASATRCALAGRIRGENKRLHHASSFGAPLHMPCTMHHRRSLALAPIHQSTPPRLHPLQGGGLEGTRSRARPFCMCATSHAMHHHPTTPPPPR
jgi:hypothetical protein